MIHAVIIEMKSNPDYGFDGQPKLPYDTEEWECIGQVGTNKWGHLAYLLKADNPERPDPYVADGWDWHLVDLGL